MEKNTELEASGCSDPGTSPMFRADSQQEHSPRLLAKKFSWTIKEPILLQESQPHIAEQEAESE